MTKDNGASEQKEELLLIVGIGASAGGQEAMVEFLKNLSPDTGMAYIYIQHLDPDHESSLSDIFQRVTRMKVMEATDLLPIKPDHLYIIPPNKEIVISGGYLKLSKRPGRPAKQMPVDRFFLSLAKEKGAIGIILSGMASDGAMGLKAIKEAGGITYVQDDTARFQSMPKSAIAEGVVDAVLSPSQMAAEIEKLGSQRHLLHAVLSDDEDVPDETAAGKKAPETDLMLTDISGILQLMRNSTGVEFRHYKDTTIRRRIMRRMVLYKLGSLPEYLDYIRKTPGEIQLLYKDLLINVTSFFRDPAAMEYTQKEILPVIIGRLINNSIRVWVPACSTGEEAYSLAILIMDVLGNNAKNILVQVFATDLSEAAITKARIGVYSASDVAGVSPKRLSTYFVQLNGHYRIIKSIRDICVFAPHNVFKDPPFSRMDLISCCNLMIYLDNQVQSRILANFHYALNQGRFLILGKSETVSSSGHLYSQLDKRLKIYIKKDVDSTTAFETKQPVLLSKNSLRKFQKEFIPPALSEKVNLESLIDDIILSNYSPAGVVVTHDLDIVHFRGEMGLYLELPSGKASLNLLKLARSGLGLELRNAVQKVLKTGGPFKKTGIEISYQGNIHQVTFEITTLDTQSLEKYLLIVFQEVQLPSIPEMKASFSKDRRAKQLEAEIIALREDMRAIVEEQEAANEELQSANEEIVSSNEELQSINEELETSKEEVESSNEELMTINQELQMRNEQLAESQDYTEAIIATIRESILVLDTNLRVKAANKAFYNTFKTKQSETEGKYIYELGNGQWNLPELRELLENFLPQSDHFNGYEIRNDFEGVGEKVLLLNVRRISQKMHPQHFILVAIEDITQHRENEKLLEEREAWLRNMADNVPVMIWVAAADENFTFLNKTWLAFTGRTLLQETGAGWLESVHPDDLGRCLNTYRSSFVHKKPFQMEYRMRRHDQEYRWILNSGVPTYSSFKEFTGFTGSCVETHDKKMLNQELEIRVSQRTRELEEMNSKLERSNTELEQFAYIASHDLQEPLRKIITFSNRLSEVHGKILPDSAKDYLTKIESSSERMKMLISELLNFSKISRADKNFVAVDLNKIFSEIESSVELMIQEKGAVIRKNNLPILQANEVQMNQLFFNLMINALKFSAGSVPLEITVDCRALDPESLKRFPSLDPSKLYYEIILRDNGIGFRPEYAEKIFIIFQRLNETSQFRGTGIGLALCRKIVENHGGAIYAEGRENEGAAFFVVLPAEQG